MSALHRAAWRAIALTAVFALPLWASPAKACGCGGYIPHDGTASVSRERALLRWDGSSEQLVLSLDVLGTAAEAALLLPVPARASVRLADAGIWAELDRLAAPTVRHERLAGPAGFGGRVGAPPPVGGVTVLERQTLGPFDVSNLAATDATELVRWLNDNGYSLSAGLARTLDPYVAQGWYYVAIRLRPGSGAALQGSLDPLSLTFAASAPVYPMRASANAKSNNAVTLYVLANHRVQKPQRFGTSEVGFAGWVEPSDLAPSSPLGPFVDRRLFLTQFRDTVEPALVNDDFQLAFADADATYRAEIVVYDNDGYDWGTDLSRVGVPLLAIGTLGVVVVSRRRKKRGAA